MDSSNEKYEGVGPSENSDRVKKVEHLHNTFTLPVGDVPKMITPERAKVRFNIMQEELNEYLQAAENEDLQVVSKELMDLLTTVYGTAVEHGLTDLVNDMFNEVHRSNMSKVGEDGKPMIAENGKIIKGPNYVEPDIARFLKDDNVKYE